MQHQRTMFVCIVLLVGICLGAALRSARAQAGGFGLYEVGLPNQGESYAGQAATADTAGTTYLNPAGLTRLHRPELVVGGDLFAVDGHFHPGAGSTVPGDSGGNAGTITPTAGLYLAVPLGDRWRLGFSVNSPFGISVDYDNNWVGRYFVQRIELQTLDLSPAVAYRLTDRLSLGAGLDVLNARVRQQAAVNRSFLHLPDGQFPMDVDMWGVGGRAGLLYEISPQTRLGLTYRTPVHLSLDQSVQTKNAAPVLPAAGDFHLRATLPQGANLSLYHELTPRWALLADAGWTNWSTFNSETASLNTTSFDFPRHWQDTWHAGLGTRYTLTRDWLLQAGYAYDSSPVSDRWRTPDIPVGAQHRFSVGVQYALSHDVTLSLAYTLIHLGDAAIDRTTSPLSGNLQGHFSPGDAHVVGLMMRWQF